MDIRSAYIPLNNGPDPRGQSRFAPAQKRFEQEAPLQRPQQGTEDAAIEEAPRRGGPIAGDPVNYGDLIRQARSQRVDAPQQRGLLVADDPAQGNRAIAAYQQNARIPNTDPSQGELVGVDVYV